MQGENTRGQATNYMLHVGHTAYIDAVFLSQAMMLENNTAGIFHSLAPSIDLLATNLS